MKLAKQSGDGFQYHLSAEEAHFLRLLIRQFPQAAGSPVAISKTDPKAIEREKLLNESLVAHRKELKQKVSRLVSEGKFKTVEGSQLFRIDQEGREILLQVLNDIRVESWRALGEPENLEINIFDLPEDKLSHYQFMHMAGYFEFHFLNLEENAK